MRFANGETWDFGRIQERAGTVEHTFTYRNSGRIPFAIERVSVDCGCTTPIYGREMLVPGGEATITVRFDPKGQEGPFEKRVRVTSKGGRNKNIITIKGIVVPRPKSIEEQYPFVLGSGVRLAHLTMNFGYVEQRARKDMEVEVINTSPAEVEIGWEAQPRRGFLRVEVPELLGAGERGKIKVGYDLTSTMFYGRYSDQIFLSVNGVPAPLPLSTTFTAVDTATDNGPDAVIAPLFNHHGEVKRGEKVTRTLELANDGHAPLIVRWVNPRRGMSTSLRPGFTVGPAQTATFTVTMDTSQLDKGVQTGAITIITNDPIRPVREIRSAADII